MKTVRRLILASAGALALASPASAGGPNVAVCMTLANAYNQCVVDQSRGGGWDGPDRPWGGGHGGHGGYGRGYGGYDGGWDDDEYAYWRERRRAARAGRAQAACASWLIQMKAANCY